MYGTVCDIGFLQDCSYDRTRCQKLTVAEDFLVFRVSNLRWDEVPYVLVARELSRSRGECSMTVVKQKTNRSNGRVGRILVSAACVLWANRMRVARASGIFSVAMNTVNVNPTRLLVGMFGFELQSASAKIRVTRAWLPRSF